MHPVFPTPQWRQVYEAARSAAIHGTIMHFPDGYATQVGERGLKVGRPPSGRERMTLTLPLSLSPTPPVLALSKHVLHVLCLCLHRAIPSSGVRNNVLQIVAYNQSFVSFLMYPTHLIRARASVCLPAAAEWWGEAACSIGTNVPQRGPHPVSAWD